MKNRQSGSPIKWRLAFFLRGGGSGDGKGFDGFKVVRDFKVFKVFKVFKDPNDPNDLKKLDSDGL